MLTETTQMLVENEELVSKITNAHDVAEMTIDEFNDWLASL